MANIPGQGWQYAAQRVGVAFGPPRASGSQGGESYRLGTVSKASFHQMNVGAKLSHQPHTRVPKPVGAVPNLARIKD